MRIRTKSIELDPKKPIYVTSDSHLGGKDSADNAIASSAGLQWMMSGPRAKWSWIFGGDTWELWQYSQKQVDLAWPEFSDWAKHQVRVRGNHDEEDTSPDILKILWGKITVVIIHDPTFEYQGKWRKICKWAVRRLWTPIERIIGWKRGIELSSAINKNHKPYRKAAYRLACAQNADIIIYGHTHEKPFILIKTNVTVVNTGTFSNGRMEIVKISQTGKRRIRATIDIFNRKERKTKHVLSKKIRING